MSNRLSRVLRLSRTVVVSAIAFAASARTASAKQSPSGRSEFRQVLPPRGPIALIVLSGLDVHADRHRLLEMPENARGIAVFAHGSGSGSMSPRNARVAHQLNQAGFGTLLFDLLTEAEAADRANVFNIELLSERLVAATAALSEDELASLPIGYFGASTGAAAALHAAATLRGRIAAVVSRGGRPDLAGEALSKVEAPTLLIVGGDDTAVLELNRAAQEELRCPSELVVIPGAGHLFEEPGALEAVSEHAIRWFDRHL
jgi:putative phosphoribosyl transferase